MKKILITTTMKAYGRLVNSEFAERRILRPWITEALAEPGVVAITIDYRLTCKRYEVVDVDSPT